MDRRGFLTCLLLAPAAAVGIKLYPPPQNLPGVIYEPHVADPDAMVNILEYHGDAPPLDEKMLDEAFQQYWTYGEASNRRLMGVLRKENERISKCADARF